MERQKKKLAACMLVFLISCFILGAAGCSRFSHDSKEETAQTETAAESRETQKIEHDMIQIGDPNKSTDLSVVLVSDTSSSMLASDNERVAIEAAKMFIDMTKNSSTDIALVEFANIAVKGSEATIQNRSQKEALKNSLDGISYNGATDIGAAMKLSAELMAHMLEQNPDNQKAVILFTDGNTYVGEDSDKLRISLQKEEDAAKALSDMGCPIYMVGLNCDGSVDEEKLKKYAKDTGGEALITQNPSQLPMFFNQIFKKLGNIDDIKTQSFHSNGQFQTIDVDIMNSSIKEANILLLSDQRIQDIRLYAPGSDTPVDMNQDKCYYTTSEKYSMVKLTNPQKGLWKADIRGAAGENIWLSFLYNYDINMIGTLDRKQLYRKDDVFAEIYLTSEGKRITDPDFYKEMSAYAVVTEETTGESSQVKLLPDGNGMTGSFSPEKLGSYSVAFHIDGQGLYRDSELLHLEVLNQPVVQTKEISPMSIKKGESVDIDLADYFMDPDGDIIQFECIAPDDDVVLVSRAGDVFKLQGLDSGTEEIAFVAKDGHGSEISFSLSGTVTTFFERWRYPIVIGAVVVGLLVLGCVFRFRPRVSKGYLLISLIHKVPGSYGKIASAQYKLHNGFSMASLGHGVNLARVMERFSSSYRTMSVSAKANELDALLGSISQELKNVRISATSDPFRISVTLPGGKAAFCDSSGNPISDKRKQVECQNGRRSGFNIVIQKDAETKECVIFTIYYSRDLC